MFRYFSRVFFRGLHSEISSVIFSKNSLGDFQEPRNFSWDLHPEFLREISCRNSSGVLSQQFLQRFFFFQKFFRRIPPGIFPKNSRGFPPGIPKEISKRNSSGDIVKKNVRSFSPGLRLEIVIENSSGEFSSDFVQKFFTSGNFSRNSTCKNVFTLFRLPN